MSVNDPPAEEPTEVRPDSSPAPSRRSESRFTPGAILAERYRIVALLGRGGMGEVFRAEDMKLGQQVALKFLPPDLAQRPDRLESLYAELRLGRQVSHPNVCRLYDVFEWEGSHFISMEYIDGEDLASLLRRIGKLPHDKALDIARDLSAGLAAAHATRIVHRDLKPANVMIDSRGTARITDFGLAALSHDLAGSTPVAGTPAYMAPEQLSGGEITVRTDLYALGLIFYEMFTGKRLFEAKSVGEIISQHRTPHTHSISQETGELDPAVRQVILRCLEERPEDRPASIHSIMHALPGGDPLQAAIDAGETPSPEMVAAAGTVGETRPPIAWCALALAIAGLLLAAGVASRAKLYNRVSLPNEPAVLAHRADELIEQLGYGSANDDNSFYFNWDDDYFRYASSNRLHPDVDAVRPSPVIFRYRTSPTEMVPWQKERLLDHIDPPFVVPGMTRIGLDPRGQLLYFEAIPRRAAEQPEGPEEDYDWQEIFDETGIDPASLRPVPPVWPAPVDGESSFAWEATYPGGEPIRIEAASRDGKPVWFALIPQWREPFLPETARQTLLFRVLGAVNVASIISILVIGLALLRRNWRRGRGDRRGALRLGVFAGLTLFGARLFRAEHSLDPATEWGVIEQLLAEGVLGGLTTWMFYLALEPYVRRRWPRILIGWTRLLAGRFRDPLVGRDLLTGIVAGAFGSVIVQSSIILPRLFGIPELSPIRQYFTALSDSSQIIHIILRDLSLGAAGAVALGVFFLILQLVFRKPAFVKATAVVFLTLGLTGSGLGGRGELLAVELPINLLLALLFVFVFFRYGILAMAVMLCTTQVLYDVPTTLDPAHWYFGRSALVLALLALLAVHGFRSTLAHQPMFGGLLVEEEV